MEIWQVLVTSSVLAAIVTIGLTRLLKRWDDDALRSATKQAIQAEIDYASEFALDYLKPGSVRQCIASRRRSTTKVCRSLSPVDDLYLENARARFATDLAQTPS